MTNKIDFVRCDFYETTIGFVFSEFTWFPDAHGQKVKGKTNNNIDIQNYLSNNWVIPSIMILRNYDWGLDSNGNIAKSTLNF